MRLKIGHSIRTMWRFLQGHGCSVKARQYSATQRSLVPNFTPTHLHGHPRRSAGVLEPLGQSSAFERHVIRR